MSCQWVRNRETSPLKCDTDVKNWDIFPMNVLYQSLSLTQEKSLILPLMLYSQESIT